MPIKRITLAWLVPIVLSGGGCSSVRHNGGGNGGGSGNKPVSGSIRLIMLAPGHFHAALLQKYTNGQIDPTVHVYAPEGPELQAHLALIDRYNARTEDPTGWKEKVYAGPDYLEKMLLEKPGNVVVIAGNNRGKTDYIKKSVDAGLNVLADKPMVITTDGFEKLREAFADAGKNNVLLYDIMTERYEITNIMQKELSLHPALFGELEKGTLEDPAIEMESVHYFYKEVSGSPLVRPAWYFDVRQQGEGISDVTTHLVDLVQWECFPREVLDYKTDIRMLSARHWATVLSPSEFTRVTNMESYPDYLKRDVKDSLLQVYANGVMNYTIKGVHVRVSVTWKYQAPAGTGDTYYAKLKGTKAKLVIRQGKEEKYKPVVYIEPANSGNSGGHDRTEQDRTEQALKSALEAMQPSYPGVDYKKSDAGWELVIPGKYDIGHEQHFAAVVKNYIGYLQKGSLPDWEITGMLAKYYTLTQALKMAVQP